MVHLFKYARGNKYLPLIQSEDKSGILKWYIDRSHAVHPDALKIVVSANHKCERPRIIY